LLERDLELRKVDDAIAGAGDGSGRVMVFEGVAGIGKTALLAAAGQRAEAAGMRLLSAAGRELEQGFAFGVATQLLEPEVIALDAAEHERAFAGAAAPAASMLGGGSASAPAPDAGFSIIHALYWLIANLAETRPLVLIVDDLQWVDLPSREAVAYLTSRLDELPVFLACAVRTGDPDTDAPDPRLLKDAPVEVVRLQPLSPAGVGVIVRATLGSEASDGFRAACHEATGGNPFLARELARSAAQEGFGGADADVEALRGLTPRGVSRAVLPRIRALGPAARAVSESVAVLEQAQLRHVAALASVAESQTVGAVDRLAEAGILADGLPLRYAHPILRTAVYRDLSSAAREHAHHRAAALLAEAGDDDAAASHLERTEPRGEDWAAEALERAGRRALAAGAPGPAAAALRRALAEGSAPDTPDLLLDLGRAEAASGEPRAAERLAAAHERASDPETRARVLATLAETQFVGGQMAAALDNAREALETATSPPGSPPEVQLYLGYVMLARAYGPTAGDARDRIRGRAEADAADGALGETARLAALAYDGFLGGERADHVREAASAALADSSLLDAGGPAAQTFLLTTWALAGADGFDPAEEAIQRAFDRAAERGSFLEFATACHHRMWSRWRRGRVVEAVADTEVALELAAMGWELIGPAAGWARAECLLEIGDVAAATEAVELAERVAAGLTGSCVEAWPLMGRSRLALERGDSTTALDAALRCGSIMSALHAENPAVAEWRSRAALAAAALGDGDRARELWNEELERAQSFGAQRAIGIAQRAGGLVEEGQGRIALLRGAVETLESSPARLEHCRALLDLGVALRHDRQAREAREPLRVAARLAGEAGAAALAARAKEELMAAGARPRRDAYTGIEALTPRELRIARLAAQGQGNRDIAQALFITRKTVEAHMRNIFRKLEIESRGELPGVLPPP
jgi:DNA-binding CsgD family transcriptional regulator